MIHIITSKNIIAFRKRRKKNLIEIKGNACCICGFNAFPEALEFHHIDPTTKKYQISSSSCKSFEKDLSEVKKCALLCANCHRGVHANVLKIPDNWDYINNKLVQNIRFLTNKKHYYCNDCGKEIATKSLRCTECAHKARRTSERPSKNDLKLLIRTTPFLTIGKQYSVSDNAIKKWCKYYNLPYRKKDILLYSDSDWDNL